jgi:hypothetical protein
MDADRRPISQRTIGGHRHYISISLNCRIAWMLIKGPSVGVYHRWAPSLAYHQSKWQDCMDVDIRPIIRCTIGGHRHWLIVSLNGRIAWMLIEGPSVGVP